MKQETKSKTKKLIETVEDPIDPREQKIESLRRLKEERYRYFEPTGKGEEFIDMIGSGEKFITLFSAGNGIGKTATCVNILAHIFWPIEENPYFNFDLFKKWPFPKKLRIVSDPTNIEKNIIPAMEDWFPRGRYEHWKGNKKFFSKWETDTGWEIDIMTYEQSPREFEGPTFGLIWFDEPPPQELYKANISRLRKGGIMFISGTPLAGSAYLYDMFAKGEVEIDVQMPNGETVKHVRRVGYVEADVESACKIHGIRGHLEHEDIMQMIAEYTEDEKQARIYGKFQHLIGMVFKKWDRKIHVIKPFHINKSEFSVVQYIDPHPRNPDAVMWVATDRNNTKYICDELFIVPADTEDLCEQIRNKDDNYRIVDRKADPSAFIVNQHDKRQGETQARSLMDRMADYGLYYVPASKRRAEADRRIEDALSYAEVNGIMIKAPELYVFDTCKVTIFEMEHYRWDEHVGKSADKHDRKEKPIDKDDHMIENLGRILLDEHTFRPRERRVNENGPLDSPDRGRRNKNSDDPYD
jgi:phage terminase large subunit-like protein